MAKETKYSIVDLKRDFPNEEACLAFLFDSLHSRKCDCGGDYRQIKGRKQFQCSKCRFQIAPASGTIFHKSDTPLSLWFHAIFVFSNAKSGISAKQLERELGVTYKCAWRMLSLIRKALKQDTNPLSGVVETDAAYIGGHKYAGKNNANMSETKKNKSIIMVAIERGGRMKAQIASDMSADATEDFLKNNVATGSFLLTDSFKGYDRMKGHYDVMQVNHRKREFARGSIHVNSAETWFSHIKRCMRGTFKSVSKQHLQAYLDSFVWHYNNRHNDRQRFSSLFGALLQPSK